MRDLLPPAPTKSAVPRAERVLTFEDNSVLGQLFGEFDQNLALIEHKLGVDVAARGNHVFVRGTQEACAQAEMVLLALYDRLKAGAEISAGDVDGALRLAAVEPTLFAGADLPEMSLPAGAAKISTRRRTITARTPMQDKYMRALERSEMVFATGPAGTGKTYLAVAYAAALLERGQTDRIVLSRPAVEAGERLGFLPGDMREKVDPYLRPLYDALYDMMAPERVERGLQTGAIEIAPLAFMRGRTLANAVVILDEAQNCTAMQMKMFLTRLGENGRMIVTGDPSQVDLPPGQTSGLVQALGLLRDVEGISMIGFSEKDVVRHELVARIVRAYDAADRDRAAARERKP